MKTYIVPGLDSNDQKLLSDHGLVFYPWNGNDILVNETQLPRMLELLSATAQEGPSEFEGMYTLSLTFNPALQFANARPRANNAKVDVAKAHSRAKYAEMCSHRIKELIKQSQSAVAARRKALLSVQEQFLQQSRQKHVAAASISDDWLAKEFERVLTVPKVASVRVANNTVLVYTDMLYATNPATKAKHELGMYLIQIRLDGAGGEAVRWFNLTRKVRTVEPGMNAPRIYGDGAPCSDEIKEALLELLAHFEIATVVELAIQFVETLADDELSRFIEKWPPVRS